MALFSLCCLKSKLKLAKLSLAKTTKKKRKQREKLQGKRRKNTHGKRSSQTKRKKTDMNMSYATESVTSANRLERKWQAKTSKLTKNRRPPPR